MVTATKLLTNDQVWLIAGAAVLAHRGAALLPCHRWTHATELMQAGVPPVQRLAR